MKNENEEPQYQIESLKEPMALGEVFAKSGLFPDTKTQAQAAVKILAGRELGLSPFEAMNGLYFVNNKLAMYSNIMATLVRKNKKYDYVVNKIDDTECTITMFFKENGSEKVELGKSTFSIKDAAKAGIVNKDVWKNYPRNMLFARALANGVRWYAPDAVSGYHAVEEFDDIEAVKAVSVIEMSDDKGVQNG